MSDISGLVLFVKNQAGDNLRAIGEFEGVRTDLHFIRDDLDETEITARFELIQDNITWSWSPPENELDDELGPKYASLQVRQEAVIIHLPTGTDQGILIGLESEAATDLTSFLEKCADHVPDSAKDEFPVD